MFKDNFVWGASASSFQIEGAVSEDGRGQSIWDVFTRKAGAVFGGHNADTAIDHYHRYREDVALMAQLGIKHYRLSVAWPRVLPDGIGALNEAGLGFYDSLVDALLEAGITPWVTLFHWDYPMSLYNRGGWLNPDSPAWFAEYTSVLVDALSDRVTYWFTQNEPQVYLGLAYVEGIHAPGLKVGWQDFLLMNHHSLLAHGLSVQVIRARARKTPLVGTVPVSVTYMPLTDAPADIEAARRKMFAVDTLNVWNNSLYTDPMFLGRYPDDALRTFEGYMPRIGANDLATIAQPLDFYGCNLYHGEYVRAGVDGQPEVVEALPGHAMTTMNWWVRPEAMYWGPKFLYERYGLPIIIAENGLANTDWVSVDGAVHDPQRIDFTARYLMALRAAAADGVAVDGYFHWSAFDNFEWAEGYKQRFGLIYVDYRTQQRIPKDSAYWYRTIMESNGAALPPGRFGAPDLSRA